MLAIVLEKYDNNISDVINFGNWNGIVIGTSVISWMNEWKNGKFKGIQVFIKFGGLSLKKGLTIPKKRPCGFTVHKDFKIESHPQSVQ